MRKESGQNSTIAIEDKTLESINQHITFRYAVYEGEWNTQFRITIAEQSYVIRYHLLANDCFFDLENKNYFIEINILKSYFDKYNALLLPIDASQNICCTTQAKLYELIHCKLEGLQRKLFLESAVLFLVFQLQKTAIPFQLPCDTCEMANKPIEVQKIEKARAFILKNLSESLTIPIIASAIGTNQCYLKKGFKEYTGLTIFEYIQENRMATARHLLQTTNKPISEVAMDTGYASISSFSQAFKNFYGINPSTLSKENFPNN